MGRKFFFAPAAFQSASFMIVALCSSPLLIFFTFATPGQTDKSDNNHSVKKYCEKEKVTGSLGEKLVEF